MMKVSKFSKGSPRIHDALREQHDGYRVMYHGWVVDVVKTPAGWGLVPIRRTTDKLTRVGPKGPFGSKDEMLAMAGVQISVRMAKQPT